MTKRPKCMCGLAAAWLVLAWALGGCDTLVDAHLVRQLELLGVPASAVAGQSFSATVQVHSVDTFVGQLTLSTTDAHASFPPIELTAADAGSKALSITLTRAGAQTLTLSSHGLQQATAKIAVQPAAAASFTTNADRSSWVAGSTHSVTVLALDPYGNLATAYGGSVQFASTAANAKLPAGGLLDEGRATFSGFELYTANPNVALTAQDASGMQGGTQVQVVPAAPNSLHLSGVATAPLLGQPQPMVVQLTDAYGNICTNYAGTLTANSNDVAATFDLSTATFTSRDAGTKTIGQVAFNSVGNFDLTVLDPLDGISAHQAVYLQHQLVGLANASSGRSICAIIDSGDVKCWGDNTDGGLGIGDTDNRGSLPNTMGDRLPTVNLGTGRKAAQVAVGTNSACALLTTGEVKCWGHNGDGEVGVGDTVNRGDSLSPGHGMGDALPAVALNGNAVAVAAGRYHYCAIITGGVVKCWGYNGDGELGTGDTFNRLNGDNSHTQALVPVNLGAGRTARSLAMQAFGSCALLDNGAVTCWGFNGCLNGDCTSNKCGPSGCGQLGVGDATNRGDSTAPGHALAPVNLGTARTATALTSGDYFGCALLDNHSVKCWGINTVGQLGVGDTASRGDSSAAGHTLGDDLPAVNLPAGRTAQDLHAGIANACARLDNMQVVCWGWNSYGQLGVGNTSDVGGSPGYTLTPALLGAGRTAQRLTSLAFSNCVQLDTGDLRCFGSAGTSSSPTGELGLGDIVQRGDSPTTSGDYIPFTQLW